MLFFLQVVLCFSPVGFTLRTRARKFPALVNCTAIDWFHPWPQLALQSVSSTFIDKIPGLDVRRYWIILPLKTIHNNWPFSHCVTLHWQKFELIKTNYMWLTNTKLCERIQISKKFGIDLCPLNGPKQGVFVVLIFTVVLMYIFAGLWPDHSNKIDQYFWLYHVKMWESSRDMNNFAQHGSLYFNCLIQWKSYIPICL